MSLAWAGVVLVRSVHGMVAFVGNYENFPWCNMCHDLDLLRAGLRAGVSKQAILIF